MKRTMGIVVGGLFVALACSGKSAEQGRIASSETAETNLPAVEVKLPPPPSYGEDEGKDRDAEGTYTVRGLRRHLAALRNQEVSVQGVVLKVYTCPCAPQDTACRCEKPHFFIGDQANIPHQKGLLVTDYPASGRASKPIKEGTRLRLTGRLLQTSPSGFSATDGLLVCSHMTVVADPPAP